VRLVAREPQQPSELDGSFGALDPRRVRVARAGETALSTPCASLGRI
jgi:hypothetical protein